MGVHLLLTAPNAFIHHVTVLTCTQLHLVGWSNARKVACVHLCMVAWPQPKKKEEKKYLRDDDNAVNPDDVPLDDPIAEKLRQQRCVHRSTTAL
jgi:hypothetical protein